jgi:hypothetical protein
MQAAIVFLSSYATRILGIAQGTVALLCGMTGVIPDHQMKYWLAASAVLTFWRGQSVSSSFNAAVAAKAPPIPPFVPPQVIK